MSEDLWKYLPRGAVAETTGRDRKEAIANAFAFMNAHSKGRRSKAEDRYIVTRVRQLGAGMWAVRYRRR